jgi:hypothetical protein
MSEETRERLLRIGKRAQQKSLPFVKWNNGTFEINDREVIHSQWIAMADQATAGWVRWNHNFSKVEEKTATVCIYDHDEPPKPKIPAGEKDLWRSQLELPLQQIETGELAIFSSGYEWTRQAIGAAVVYFAQTRRRPIVQLESRETVKDGKTIIIGALDIVAPDESDGRVVDLTKDGVAASNSSGTSKQRNSDMDDDIPF